MGRIFFAGFNLVGGIVITGILILSVENTPYPTAVGVGLALLIGGALTAAGAGLPVYFWWGKRRDDRLPRGDGEP